MFYSIRLSLIVFADLPGSSMVSPETSSSPLDSRAGVEARGSAVVDVKSATTSDIMTPGEQRMLLSLKSVYSYFDLVTFYNNTRLY